MDPYSTAQREVVASLACLSTTCRETPQAEYPFVAVEFDIFKNTVPTIRDPNGDHVGIDINFLKSNITMPWISYNSSSKNLNVAFTSFLNGTNGIQVETTSYLSYIVDLKQYLPDWVIVWFSAATGNELAVHKILSWNFTSTALVDEGNKPVFPVSIPTV
ncbi:PREDICTED: L-type lectin-domain containing [Prunus dulcis]|uniref:PREDICTED: L-type lectin-domain containing n=1 Tax=Prunus dulcis TaxID=3755 RepID=A0A5E4EMK1_PRUDU|nr:PREDICTED: L-type lectin-domain containing [Prunus dulcis]